MYEHFCLLLQLSLIANQYSYFQYANPSRKIYWMKIDKNWLSAALLKTRLLLQDSDILRLNLAYAQNSKNKFMVV